MSLRYRVEYETDPPELVLFTSTMRMAKWIATEAAKERPGVGVSIMRYYARPGFFIGWQRVARRFKPA